MTSLNQNGVRIGRPPTGLDPILRRARSTRYKKSAREKLLERITVADFETDPFDNTSDVLIVPFLFNIYSPDFGHITLWRDPETEPYPTEFNDPDLFVIRCVHAIEALPGRRVVYAHNGGKFDWKILIHLLHGKFMRKGSSIMKICAGRHELRDSVHIYPGKLASYNKTATDYSNMARDKREAYKQEIIDYCKSDCTNLYDIVHAFVKANGFAASIGSVSKKEVKKHYPDILNVGEHTDGKIRGVDTSYYHKDTYGKRTYTGYFHGGRVQCLWGRARYDGTYTVYDVNSMYPFVMARYSHPIGACFDSRTRGDIGPNTFFLHVRCRNHGALLTDAKNENGVMGLTTEVERGDFYTTIHEFNVALRYNLLEDVEIVEMIDCDSSTNFANAIEPLYNERALIKGELEALARNGEQGSPKFLELTLQGEFKKLLLNNMYGKFAQNPRKYHTEYWVPEGEPCEDPEAFVYERLLDIGVVIWRRRKDIWNDRDKSFDLRSPKDQLRFYNVAAGASITGAARAVLLEAICCADDPIYCDTDSIICRSLGGSAPLSQVDLGAWKKEYDVTNVMIAAKKLYGYVRADTGKWKAKAKGVPEPSMEEMERVTRHEKVKMRQKGITIGFDRRQQYQEREIAMNVALGPSNLRKRIG